MTELGTANRRAELKCCSKVSSTSRVILSEVWPGASQTESKDLHFGVLKQMTPPLSISRHRLRRVRTAIVITLALAVASADAIPRKHALLNNPAPTFRRTSLDNQLVDLATLRGRVVLLNFWATWCAACAVEMPRFVEWQQKYVADGLSIIGVSMDDDSSTVKVFLARRRLNYPVVMGDEELGLQYGGVLGLPVTYLIDRTGIIRGRYQAGTSLDALERAVLRALRNP